MSRCAERLQVGDSPARGGASTGLVVLALLAGALGLGCGSSSGPAAAPRSSATAASSAVSEPPPALVTACYDCHSDRGGAPWNARLAPSYWFSESARKDLDFSQWAQYDSARRATDLLAVAKSVREGSMPPHDYTLLHPAAKLTPAEQAAIVRWASQAASQ